MEEKIKTKCIAFLVCALLSCFSFGALAQSGISLKGRVIDADGEGLAGALIQIVGTTRGVSADDDGRFELPNVTTGTKLKVTYLGKEDKQITFDGKNNITVVLEDKGNELDEVQIVGFGKQKKESVVSSISTVNISELRVPSSNLTTALQGRIAGLISYQTSGEPGMASNAEFFVRGVATFGKNLGAKADPLILIDNMEVSATDLARLHPDDLATFSILKDATATAVYGARGANGVIMVTTKEGKEGKARFSFRVENGWSTPTSQLEMADAITYMRVANEAYSTRTSPFSGSLQKGTPNPQYTINKIYDTQKYGEQYPDVFPTTDWMGMMIKDYATSQRVNMSISGGSPSARYYVSGSFANDNGILIVDKQSSFNNNINYKQYTLHTNFNINVSSSTELVVRLHGGFSDYQGPLTGGNAPNGGSYLYGKMLNVSPVRFPAYFDKSKLTGVFANAPYILFGNQGDELINYMNPYAEMLKGYQNNGESSLMAQMELKQDFSKWIKGLSGRIMGNTSRTGSYALTRQYTPFYFQYSNNFNYVTHTYGVSPVNPNLASTYLVGSGGSNAVSANMYGEAALDYISTFNEVHNISAMLIGIGSNRNRGSAQPTMEGDKMINSALINSLPQRNLGLSGRFTYNFDSRYFGEFNFGYNGSEKFAKDHRWGFFPSVGLGYVISNEQFWANLKDKITMLKLKYTYGLVGNDAISNRRFFYLSNVTQDGAMGFQAGLSNIGFGQISVGNQNITLGGWKVSTYANPDVGWEISYKHNIGLELEILKDFMFQVDVYRDNRRNILQERAGIPVEMGLYDTPLVNVGQALTKGIDVAIDLNHSFTKDFWIGGRANFTFAQSKYLVYEEAAWDEFPTEDGKGYWWRSKIGRTTTQEEGFIADGLFVDIEQINNKGKTSEGKTPDQKEYFGSDPMPGDIKYVDINDDGYINEVDIVPIGYPTTPEINYGFGLSAGYKAFDVSFFFTGSDRASFFISPTKLAPFIYPDDASIGIEERGLAQFIADDYWSENNTNPNAAWPRLGLWAYYGDQGTTPINNIVNSTYWLRDNSYIRLKQAEIGYTLPANLTRKFLITNLRIYLNATNLFLISKFKTWDVELAGNGLNYPLQRVINVGANLSF